MFVIVARNFPPDVGGIQSLMEGLSKSLLNHGPVKVFAESFPNSEKYDDQLNLDINRVSGFKVFRKYRKANLVNEYIKNNNIRAIFFDHWKSLELINSDFLNKTCHFCLIHSKEINHMLGSSLNKRMNKSFLKSRFIIANSKYTKDLAIKVGLEKNKIHIINPGTYHPIKIEDENINKAKEIFGSSFPKIITVGRLDKRKNHQNILMTIKNLKPIFPNIKYISVGDGEERINLEKLKKQLGLSDEVVFFVKTNESLKAALLKEANLFLMPSIVHKKSVEGFGISFIEAGSYGLGSIGGVAGGQSDAIIDKETGYLCDGNDLGSIYENIVKFFENEKYKTFGIQAKKFSQRFKWEDVVKQYLKLI